MIRATKLTTLALIASSFLPFGTLIFSIIGSIFAIGINIRDTNYDINKMTSMAAILWVIIGSLLFVSCICSLFVIYGLWGPDVNNERYVIINYTWIASFYIPKYTVLIICIMCISVDIIDYMLSKNRMPTYFIHIQNIVCCIAIIYTLILFWMNHWLSRLNNGYISFS